MMRQTFSGVAGMLAIALSVCVIGAFPSGAANAQEQTAMDLATCPKTKRPSPDVELMARSLIEPGSTFKPIRLSDIPQTLDRRSGDYAGLCRYQNQNATLSQHPQVVFMGDSITDAWIVADPAMFDGRYVDRGISGQTTGQMLGRFMADVVALKPKMVHIMGGTNDIAGNMGPTTEGTTRNNIAAMVIIARANGIKVVLASILPADHFWWAPQWQPAKKIAAMNRWLKAYAQANRIPYVDYYGRMADVNGALPSSLSNDGVHPNTAGYSVMRPMADAAVSAALHSPAKQGDGSVIPTDP